MIDTKFLRENLDLVSEGIRKKKFDCNLDNVLALDEKRRAIIGAAEKARAGQKATNSEMAELEKGSPDFLNKVKELKTLSAHVKELQAEQQAIESSWQSLVMTIPNLPHESVLLGENEDDNKVVKTWGDQNASSSQAMPHYNIPWFEEYVDLTRGSKVTGAGFPFFVGDLAHLTRALISFFLDEGDKAGYIELIPPLLVNAESATATGQLPDKEGLMYQTSSDDFYLIPTSEVPLTNFYRDEILSIDRLPIYHCAATPCFRREAGSHGKEVRGLNRVHQFDKVELVKWTHPETSFEELEKLRNDAEQLLVKLDLPYRVLSMCTGELGFPHAKQYDLEVWAAGQKRWLEVSSCSNFTDFQARRAGIRFRDLNGETQFVHTLNGSGLALPRVLAAILENNLCADGSVTVPEVLQPWMKKKTIGSG